MGRDIQFCKMKKFWRLVVQQCEYIKHYSTVDLKMVKMVNLLCVFYHNLKFTLFKTLILIKNHYMCVCVHIYQQLQIAEHYTPAF